MMKMFRIKQLVQLSIAGFLLISLASVTSAQSVDETYFATVKKLRAEGFAGVDKALASFESIIANDPDNIYAYLGSADAYLLKYEFSGKREEKWLDLAVVRLDSAIARQADLPEAYFKRAILRLNLGYKDKAENDLKKALELLPEYGAARVLYLQYLITEKGRKQARRFAEASVSIAQDDPASTRMLADVFYREKDFENSAYFYEKVTASVSPAPYTHLALGDSYRELGENRKAVNELKKALTQNPNLHEARFALGTVYTNLGETEKAIEQFRIYLLKFPKDASVLNNLALLYEQAGQPSKAKLTWMKVKQATDDKTYRGRAERRLYDLAVSTGGGEKNAKK